MMYEISYSIDGIIRKITVSTNDTVQIFDILTNMYDGGKIDIINIRRI